MRVTTALLERIVANGGHASPVETLALAFEVQKLTSKIDDVPIAEIERHIGIAFDDTKSKDDDLQTVTAWLGEW